MFFEYYFYFKRLTFTMLEDRSPGSGLRQRLFDQKTFEVENHGRSFISSHIENLICLQMDPFTQ